MAADDPRRSLEWHAERRARGVATVSVLIGDKRAVERAWAMHVGAARAMVTSRSAEPSSVALAYLTSPFVVDRVRAGVRARAAAAVGLSHGELHARLAAMTPRDREAFATRIDGVPIPADERTPFGLLARALDPRASELVNRSAPLEDLAAAARAAGSAAPALALDAYEDTFPAQCEAAARIAEAAPQIDIAILAPEPAWRVWIGARDSHARAVLREGAIAVAPSPTHAATRRSAAAALFRSEAERALFEALERTRDTRGLFALNRRMPVRFGGQPLEIDLWCATLSVAVEVDGYHHFRDRDAYRRDRRKDVVLQQQRILVLRVLADDVADRLDDVVASIRLALDRRREEGGIVAS